MKSGLKNVFKYAVMLSVTAFLLWLSFSNIEVEGDETKLQYILKVWSKANKPFLFLSAGVAILSHLIRAERWKLLLTPLGHQTKLSYSFYSVMIGYFINLVIPRGGEVSRCYNLYRLNKTPVDVSLGTVVAERVIDLVFLILLIGASFLIEIDNLMYFFQSEEIQKLQGGGNKEFPYMIVAGGLLLIAAIYFIVRFFINKNRYFALRMILKGKKVLLGIKSGITAVFKLEQRVLFILYSLLIWICYYLMMYLVMLAFPETADLGIWAALTIFVIGGIAMAVPLPGGAGSFHILVPLGLVLLYGIAQDKAVAFTFIFHAWQTLVIIIVGALSLFLSQIARNKTINDNG